MLRQATMEDAEKLLLWKNEKDMRRFALKTSKLIKWADHVEWVKKHLKEITIIVENNIPVGVVRVSNNEVSINIDKNYRGMGIARRAIGLLKEIGMTAKIVDGNVASLRLFLSCGFKPIKHKFIMRDGKLIGYYILRFQF